MPEDRMVKMPAMPVECQKKCPGIAACTYTPDKCPILSKPNKEVMPLEYQLNGITTKANYDCLRCPVPHQPDIGRCLRCHDGMVAEIIALVEVQKKEWRENEGKYWDNELNLYIYTCERDKIPIVEIHVEHMRRHIAGLKCIDERPGYEPVCLNKEEVILP